MKKQLIWGIGLICFLLMSCSKQDLINPGNNSSTGATGSTGAAGPTGVTGATGAANVQSFSIVVQPYSWSSQTPVNSNYVTGTNYWYTTFFKVNSNQLTGSVGIFLESPMGYIALPYINNGTEYGFSTWPDTLSQNSITVIMQPIEKRDTCYHPTTAIQFKVVCIPPAIMKLHPGLNLNDYQEIKQAFRF